MLPAIFSLGIDSFAEYHQPAADEVARDLRREFIPRQSVISPSGFDPDMLDSDQMRRAACLRVLAWHVFPRLAVEQPASVVTAQSENSSEADSPGDTTTTSTSSDSSSDDESATPPTKTSTSNSETTTTADESTSSSSAEVSKTVQPTFDYKGAISVYRDLYREELVSVIEDGILYISGGRLLRVFPRRFSEQKRLLR